VALHTLFKYFYTASISVLSEILAVLTPLVHAIYNLIFLIAPPRDFVAKKGRLGGDGAIEMAMYCSSTRLVFLLKFADQSMSP
jgi:hypothetical protein